MIRHITRLFLLTFILTITPLAANEDFFQTVTGVKVTFTETELLANDGFSSFLGFIGTPAHGTLSLASGIWTYQPNSTCYGWEELSYSTPRKVEKVWIRISPLVVPLAGDWNNDGSGQLGFYNSYYGVFYRCDTVLTTGATYSLSCTSLQWPGTGIGWIPLAGDWDGDGDDEFGVWDPASRTFYQLEDGFGTANPHLPLQVELSFNFGSSRATPIAGDWETGVGADDQDTVGMFEPQQGNFYLPAQHPVITEPLPFSFTAVGATLAWSIPCTGSGVGHDSVAVFDPGNLEMIGRGDAGQAGSVATYPNEAGSAGALVLRNAPLAANQLLWYNRALHKVQLGGNGAALSFNCASPPTTASGGSGGGLLANLAPPPASPPPNS